MEEVALKWQRERKKKRRRRIKALPRSESSLGQCLGNWKTSGKQFSETANSHVPISVHFFRFYFATLNVTPLAFIISLFLSLLFLSLQLSSCRYFRSIIVERSKLKREREKKVGNGKYEDNYKKKNKKKKRKKRQGRKISNQYRRIFS